MRTGSRDTTMGARDFVGSNENLCVSCFGSDRGGGHCNLLNYFEFLTFDDHVMVKVMGRNPFCFMVAVLVMEY